MSVTLNDTTPAAPSGGKNAKWQADGSGNVSAYLQDMTGDSGSGGADGLVPAPAAGTAAAGKYLKADGTWAVPPGTGGGGGGSGNVTPDTHPSSPQTIDDEFEAGSLDSKWTQTNSPTLALLKGSLVLSTPSNGGNNANLITQPIPTAPYRVACKSVGNFWMPSGNTNKFFSGLAVTDGTKIWMFGIGPNSGSWYIYWRRYSNYTTQLAFSRIGINDSPAPQLTYPPYFAIYDDGSTTHFQISYDGLTWIDLWTATDGVFDSSGPTSWTPTKIGLGIDLSTTTSGIVIPVSFDWFRKIL